MRTLSSHISDDPTMNLISETHHLYERREYTFNILSEYSIITHLFDASSLPCSKEKEMLRAMF